MFFFFVVLHDDNDFNLCANFRVFAIYLSTMVLTLLVTNGAHFASTIYFWRQNNDLSMYMRCVLHVLFVNSGGSSNRIAVGTGSCSFGNFLF